MEEVDFGGEAGRVVAGIAIFELVDDRAWNEVTGFWPLEQMES